MIQEIPDRISAKVKDASSGGALPHMHKMPGYIPRLNNPITLPSSVSKILNHMDQACSNAKNGYLVTISIAQESLVMFDCL